MYVAITFIKYEGPPLIFIIQTLRFVQSLPKRERIPFSQKLRSADDDGS